MHKSLSLSMRGAERRKVILLFSAVGALSAGIVFVSFRLGFRGALMTVTGFPFAIMILLNAWAVSNQGWLSFPRNRPGNRNWVAALLFALSQPAGLLLAFAISFWLTPPWSLDFDEHSEEVFSRVELLQNKVAIPLGGFIGAFVALLICVVAVNVLVGKWPRHSWSWSLCISVVVTIVLVLALALDSERMLLFVWYPALGAAIGSWICEASERTAEA